ncbi:hypothetical protein HY642_02145 [Candidatus Woesearchaeota archaeon]|nr:hypothetical protein [Candidatus Woesearchaeota archaeon]
MVRIEKGKLAKQVKAYLRKHSGNKSLEDLAINIIATRLSVQGARLIEDVKPHDLVQVTLQEGFCLYPCRAVVPYVHKGEDFHNNGGWRHDDCKEVRDLLGEYEGMELCEFTYEGQFFGAPDTIMVREPFINSVELYRYNSIIIPIQAIALCEVKNDDKQNYLERKNDLYAKRFDNIPDCLY